MRCSSAARYAARCVSSACRRARFLSTGALGAGRACTAEHGGGRAGGRERHLAGLLLPSKVLLPKKRRRAKRRAEGRRRAGVGHQPAGRAGAGYEQGAGDRNERRCARARGGLGGLALCRGAAPASGVRVFLRPPRQRGTASAAPRPPRRRISLSCCCGEEQVPRQAVLVALARENTRGPGVHGAELDRGPVRAAQLPVTTEPAALAARPPAVSILVGQLQQRSITPLLGVIPGLALCRVGEHIAGGLDRQEPRPRCLSVFCLNICRLHPIERPTLGVQLVRVPHASQVAKRSPHVVARCCSGNAQHLIVVPGIFLRTSGTAFTRNKDGKNDHAAARDHCPGCPAARASCDDVPQDPATLILGARGGSGSHETRKRWE